MPADPETLVAGAQWIASVGRSFLAELVGLPKTTVMALERRWLSR